MRAFAAACEAVAATPSRLAKRAVLSAYLTSLDDAALPIACTFLAGRPFPAWDPRGLGLGYAGLRGALAGAAGLDPAAIDAAVLSAGDLGVAAERLLEAQTQAAGVSLREAHAAFEQIAATRGPGPKAARLGALLHRATAVEVKYLLKIAGGDLRIGLQQRLVEETVATAFGAPPGAVQRAAMLLGGDAGEAARLLKAGRLGEAAPRLFRPTSVMLATPAADAADALRTLDGTALVEDKLDGVRTTAHVGTEGRVALFSRRLEDVTGRFPEIGGALARLPGPLILDGEVLAWQGGRALPFGRLQRRLGRKGVTEALQREVPVIYVAFDLLVDATGSLLDAPLAARRGRLAALSLTPPLFLSPADLVGTRAEDAAARLDRRFDEARARGNEGLMVKDPASAYQPGTRGRAWLKLKRPGASLDVVVVAVEYGHGKRAGVLSDYTFAVRDGERLVPIGKAYSGLTDAEIAALTRHFLATTIEDRGALRAVEPTVVLEVAFDTIQRSDRHGGGFALRFPRILRIRDDKPVAEVDTLDTVAALYARQGWGDHEAVTPPSSSSSPGEQA